MKNIKTILIYLPVINILFDILFIFEPLRFPIALFRGGLLAFLITYFILNYPQKIWRLNKYAILLLIYFTALLFFSTNPMDSFLDFIKFFGGILMLPVYFLTIKNHPDFNKLIKSFKIAGALFILNFILSDVFHLGRSVYAEDSNNFLSGNFSSTILYIGSVIIIISPLFLNRPLTSFNKTITIVMVISLAALIAMSVRRTAILAILVAFVVFMYYYRNRGVLYTRIFQVFLIILISAPLYFSKIEDRFKARSERFEKGALEQEGRYVESTIIWDNILNLKDKTYTLFGRELFNSPGNYDYPDPTRVIHADINIIVSGAGLVGLLLYFMFYIRTISVFFKFKNRSIYIKDLKLIWVTCIALILASMAVSFSSGLLSVTYRSAVFAILGASAGLLSSRRDKSASNSISF